MVRNRRGPTLEELRLRRDEILGIAAAYGAHNIRVFGSVALGLSRPDSDIDLLVELDPDRTVLDLSGLILDLEDALGREVDVVETTGGTKLPASIEAEAVRL